MEDEYLKNDPTLTKENIEALERIKNLVIKTNQMKQEIPVRHEAVKNNFKTLRDKINSSTHYLTKIKNDIENIKFALDEDKRKFHDFNNADYAELFDKTDEQIEEEFRKVHAKLNHLQQHVSSSKEELKQINNSKSLEETLSETVQSLGEASKILNSHD